MQSIELFAGAGGLGIGLSKAGFNPVQVIEWDKWCCETININRKRNSAGIRHWPEATQADIRPLKFDEFEGKIDLVSGGPPCQPFSLGGKHKGFDDERDMWPQAVRVVKETKPKAFIFENVKGLTRASFATYLSYIELQLSYPDIERHSTEDWIEHHKKLQRHHTSGGKLSLKYNVVYEVLNSANYGIPQKRERIVFVGFRNDLEIEWNFPDPTHSLDALLWQQTRSGVYWDRHKVMSCEKNMDARLYNRGLAIKEKPKLKPWRTVRDALIDVPDPELKVMAQPTWKNHNFQPGARSYPGHTGSPLDQPAKTLKAGVHGVPGGENMLRRPDGTVRYFSIRESARLQTFPDSYTFDGSWTESMRQLGNAVPVKLAETVGRNVADKLVAVCND